jgi:hypothetical protein
MWRMLTRMLGAQACNSIAAASRPSAATWHRNMGGSKITEFATRFFAAELRAWRGEQPLWKVFWVYGVVTSGVLITFYVIAFYVDRIALRQALLLCFAPYTAWILVSVWRCAINTRDRLWSLFARLLTVAWACNTIMIVVFLQFNLITRYYLHH